MKQQNEVMDKNTENKFFTEQTAERARDILGRMERGLVLKLSLDNRQISEELEEYVKELAELTDKLSVKTESRDASSETAPCVEVCFENGSSTGLSFHGVPAGHELDSFLWGLCNASGKGQPIDSNTEDRINKISRHFDIKVLVTLSCPMCPELVIAAQHIAAKNPNVSASVYDVQHFEKIRRQYNVMSVPCLVANDKLISVGRKNIMQLLDMLDAIDR